MNLTSPQTLPVIPSPRLDKARLLKIIRTCSGVGTVWETDKRPHLGQTQGREKAWIRLAVTSYSRLGTDELRTMNDTVNQRTQMILVGQRQFTLALVARSLDPTLEAFDLCERVAYRLRTTTARDLFGPLLSLRDIQPIFPMNNETLDNRIVLVANMDVRWNSTVYTDPNQAGEGLYVEEATVGPGGLQE